MIYTLVGMSILFVGIGFIITEKNAKYLLAGYNTMSEKDRKKVDIKAFLHHFRNFHIVLGLSLLVIGFLLIYLFNENVGGIFMTVYPILAYIYFMISSAKYSKKINSKGISAKWNKLGTVILVGTLLFVLGILVYGLNNNELSFDSEKIVFEGSYGETLTTSQIQSIELVDRLPNISIRTNGFSLGTIRKGYFKTRNGETVKLILNSDNTPILLLTKNDGQKIYYSAKDRSNANLVEEIRKVMPKIMYK